MPTPAETIDSTDTPTADTATGPGASTAAPTGPGDEVLQRVVQGAHETIDRLAETAAPHMQRLQEGVNTAGDLLSSRAGQVRELGDEWAENLRSTVRDNPLAAVATALVVGLIIARLTA